MKKLVAALLSVLMVMSLSACSSQPTGTATYTAGTYTGTGAGRNGDITVEECFFQIVSTFGFYYIPTDITMSIVFTKIFFSDIILLKEMI